MPKISLIATVLNEESTIPKVLAALSQQSRSPDEIIIVDGGSRDATAAIIRQYAGELPLKLIVAPGCNISQGRNLAIRAAQGEVIAVTDAGVRLASDWLERLTAPFFDPEADTDSGEAEASEVMAVAGFFLPDADPHSPFEVAMSATVLPQLDEIEPRTFLPSSRSVAFSKSAWLAVGGYPEWLDYCEDLVFDLRLKARYGAFCFASDALVYFKPRANLRSFYKQYYLYARGDGKADLWRKRHAARYLTYGGLVPLIAFLTLRLHPIFGLLYALGAAAYLKKPYERLPRLWGNLSTPQKLIACVYVPVIRVVGDVAKMLGYPIGWLWRGRNHPPDWRAD